MDTKTPEERGPFGRLLRRIRRARDVTQGELGRRITNAPPEISETVCAMTVSHYECGKRIPHKPRIVQIARALDHPVGELLEAARISKALRASRKAEEEYRLDGAEASGEPAAESEGATGEEGREREVGTGID